MPRSIVNVIVSHHLSYMNTLATIATSHPQAAYVGLTHGILHKLSFLTRTTPKVSDILKPRENTIRLHLLSCITGKSAINDLDKVIFTLPTRFGGLGILNPSRISDAEYEASKRITGPFVDLILLQCRKYTFHISA